MKNYFIKTSCAVLAFLSMAACTTTQVDTAVGGAAGAGVGYAVGGGTGALIGGGLGALVGNQVGQNETAKQYYYRNNHRYYNYY